MEHVVYLKYQYKRGEKVVLFFLRENKFKNHGGSGFCYSDNQYSPITLPIYGSYNDYGAIENITTNGEIVLQHIKHLIQNGNLYHIEDNIVSSKKLEIKDYKNLFDAIHNGEIEDHNGCKIGFMLVLEDVYNTVIQDIGQRGLYQKYINLRGEFKKEAEDFLEQEQIAKKEKVKKLKASEEIDILSDEIGYHDNYFNNKFVQSFLTYRMFYLKYYLKEVVKTQNQELLKSMIDFCLLTIAMDLGRKMWTPQCGAGSQSQEYGVHLSIANAIKNKINKVKKTYMKENECSAKEAEEMCIKETLF